MRIDSIAQALNRALEQKKTPFHLTDQQSTWFIDAWDDQAMLGVVGTRSPLLSILEKVALMHPYKIHASCVGDRVQLSLIMPAKSCTPQVLRDGVLCLYRMAYES